MNFHISFVASPESWTGIVQSGPIERTLGKRFNSYFHHTIFYELNGCLQYSLEWLILSG